MNKEELEAIADNIAFNWTTHSAMQDLRKAWVMGAMWYMEQYDCQSTGLPVGTIGSCRLKIGMIKQ